MSKVTADRDEKQTPRTEDSLTELLRTGAKKLIAQAVEIELQEMLASTKYLTTEDGRCAVVRNGYLPSRQILTGVGSVEVQVPKVRDRSDAGVKFHSSLLPPYQRRTTRIDELLPVLYLKGISAGDMQEALSALVGDAAQGLSAATISRLKSVWQEEHQQWNLRDLSDKHYVYLWADGIFFNVRSETDRQCILVLIGATVTGEKEFIAIEDGFRESEQSWTEILHMLRSRGLTIAPALAIGDGALGFWNALAKIYPTTRQQRCWVHKTANVLNKMPKSMHPNAKRHLKDIWQAETRDEATKALKSFAALYQTKYGKAVDCLLKDQEAMLAFYDFPAVHWQHIRTSNPIESTFATVRLRTVKSRNCGSRATILSMVYKLGQNAQKRWHKLRGFTVLNDLTLGATFIDGVRADIVNHTTSGDDGDDRLAA